MADDEPEARGKRGSMYDSSSSLDRTLPSSSPTFNPPSNGPNEQKSSGVDNTLNLILAKMKYQATPEKRSAVISHENG